MADSVSSVTSAAGGRSVEDSSPPGSASDLLREATDSRTGVTDTSKLASWIADAARQNFDTASAAYRQIDAQLSQTDPAAAGHLSRDVAAAFTAQQGSAGPSSTAFTGPLWAAGNGVSEAGKAVLRNNPILQVRWISTPNAKQEVGFTRGLEELLSSKGIQFQQYPRLNTLNPSPAPQYRTYNGNQARDAIASRYQAKGYTVQTEVTVNTPLQTPKRPTGERHIDVSASKAGPTPETGIQVDVESKLGRAGLDGETRLQVAKDAWRLEQNGTLRGVGTTLETAGKILKPVGVAVDALQIAAAVHEDGNKFGPHAQRTTAEVTGGAAGGWAGAETGAAAGAAIGTLVAPGIGTAIGGVIGGLLGGFGGGWLGSKAGDAAYDATRR